MYTKKLKPVVLAAVFSVMAGVFASSQAAVVIVRQAPPPPPPPPHAACTFYKGYAVCMVRPGYYQRYTAAYARRVCTPVGHICHMEYCYKTGPLTGVCQAYTPNRVY
jgi:hypothetical protein